MFFKFDLNKISADFLIGYIESTSDFSYFKDGKMVVGEKGIAYQEVYEELRDLLENKRRIKTREQQKNMLRTRSKVLNVFFSKKTKQKEKEINNFLESLLKLQQENKIDTLLDLMYDEIDTLLRYGCFDICSDILKKINVESFCTSALMGFLTTTLPAKSKIPSRQKFYNKVKLEFLARKEDVEEMLKGLN